jgi:hypothetical protein
MSRSHFFYGEKRLFFANFKTFERFFPEIGKKIVAKEAISRVYCALGWLRDQH